MSGLKREVPEAVMTNNKQWGAQRIPRELEKILAPPGSKMLTRRRIHIQLPRQFEDSMNATSKIQKFIIQN